MTYCLLLYERKLLRIWKTFQGTAQLRVCVIVVFWLTEGEVLWEDTAFQELCSAIMLTKVWLQGCRSQHGKSQWQEFYWNLWNSNWRSLIFKRVLVTVQGLQKVPCSHLGWLHVDSPSREVTFHSFAWWERDCTIRELIFHPAINSPVTSSLWPLSISTDNTSAQGYM